VAFKDLLNYAFKLGDFECSIINDGARSLGEMTKQTPIKFFFGNAPQIELETDLKQHGGLDASTKCTFNYLLVKGDAQFTLIDAGCGDQAENEKHSKEPAGKLIENLAKSGIKREEIKRVVISHCHWDHFGGICLDGEHAFPNASYIMSVAEANYIKKTVKGWALDYLKMIERKTIFIEDSADFIPGIRVMQAPGHTPGLIVVEVSSRGESLLYTSDVIIHPLHVEHPDWSPSFETDRATAALSRNKIVDSAYRLNRLLHAPHMPSPGLGKIILRPEGFRWVAQINKQ
jgi:glyoxylase-like metal-dependent hydrolase (beta-lactamase superfamily II)